MSHGNQHRSLDEQGTYEGPRLQRTMGATLLDYLRWLSCIDLHFET